MKYLFLFVILVFFGCITKSDDNENRICTIDDVDTAKTVFVTEIDPIVNDTIFKIINVSIFDTTLIDDTIRMDDTIYNVHNDTVVYIDTFYYPIAKYDTLDIIIHDTIANNIIDSVYIYDTLDVIVYDTIINNIIDSIFVHDTTIKILKSVCPKLYDTIYVHDTLYINNGK